MISLVISWISARVKTAANSFPLKSSLAFLMALCNAEIICGSGFNRVSPTKPAAAFVAIPAAFRVRTSCPTEPPVVNTSSTITTSLPCVSFFNASGSMMP
ncbi:MAG: hypothetical protein HQM00_14095 [Magnetococcales bacterium]|nr:hypothetical protein [Magnetococcales bacterium]